ncbi:hypothetical protein P9112_009335 [Eukaryota sp. TZLM1-RC]
MSYLNCDICLDTMNLPTTLPCGHSFCRDTCLKKWMKVNSSCPSCREAIPSGPFRVNIALKDAIESSNGSNPSPHKGKTNNVNQSDTVTDVYVKINDDEPSAPLVIGGRNTLSASEDRTSRNYGSFRGNTVDPTTRSSSTSFLPLFMVFVCLAGTTLVRGHLNYALGFLSSYDQHDYSYDIYVYLFDALALALVTFSDHFNFRIGRRRPIIAFAAFSAIIPLLTLAFLKIESSTLGLHLSCILMGLFGLSIMQMFTLALIVDLFNSNVYSAAAVMVVLHSVLGIVVLHINHMLFSPERLMHSIIIICVFTLTTALTLFYAKETYRFLPLEILPCVKTLGLQLLKVFFSISPRSNFVSVCRTRFFTMLSIGGLERSFVDLMFWFGFDYLFYTRIIVVLVTKFILCLLFLYSPLRGYIGRKVLRAGLLCLVLSLIAFLFITLFDVQHVVLLFLCIVVFAAGEVVYLVADTTVACHSVPEETKGGLFLGIFVFISLIATRLSIFWISKISNRYEYEDEASTFGVSLFFSILALLCSFGISGSDEDWVTPLGYHF